jgi:hypothetical protein
MAEQINITGANPKEANQRIITQVELDTALLKHARKDMRTETHTINYIDVANTERGLATVAVIQSICELRGVQFSPIAIRLTGVNLDPALVSQLNNYETLSFGVLSKKIGSNEELKDRMQSFLEHSGVNNVAVNSNGEIVRLEN